MAIELRSGPPARPVQIGDRVVHKRALAEGDSCDDEIYEIGLDLVVMLGGTVDLEQLVDEWMHADGVAIALP